MKKIAAMIVCLAVTRGAQATTGRAVAVKPLTGLSRFRRWTYAPVIDALGECQSLLSMAAPGEVVVNRGDSNFNLVIEMNFQTPSRVAAAVAPYARRATAALDRRRRKNAVAKAWADLRANLLAAPFFDVFTWRSPVQEFYESIWRYHDFDPEEVVTDAQMTFSSYQTFQISSAQWFAVLERLGAAPPDRTRSNEPVAVGMFTNFTQRKQFADGQLKIKFMVLTNVDTPTQILEILDLRDHDPRVRLEHEQVAK